MTLRDRRRLRSVGKLVLTSAALVLLLTVVGWEAVGRALASATLLLVAVSYGVNVVRRWIDALQMSLILRFVGLRVSVGRVFLANALSAFYDLILPGGVVAAGAKWLNLAGATGEKPVTLNAVLFNRLVLLAPIVIFGSVALLWENPAPGSALPVATILLLMCFVAFVVFIYHPRLGRMGERASRRIASTLPVAVSAPLGKLLNALPPFRALKVGEYLLLLGVGTIGFGVQIVSIWFLTIALHLDVPIMVLAWAIALVSLSQQIPLTVGNLGVREGLLVLSLAPYGVNAEAAVALGLLTWGKHVATALVGAGYQVALTLGWARWKSGQPAAAALPRRQPRSRDFGAGER